MARVSIAEGIRYGFSMFAYILGVSIFGLLFVAIGAVFLMQQSFKMGALLLLVGFIVTYAGMVGTVFKVVADAVAKGNENAATGTTAQKVSDRGRSGGGTTARKVQDSK